MQKENLVLTTTENLSSSCTFTNYLPIYFDTVLIQQLRERDIGEAENKYYKLTVLD